MNKLQRFIVFSAVLCLCVVMAAGVQAQQKMGIEGDTLLPPNARPGECYARVFVPPTYKTVSEMVLKKEASEKLMVQEPKFEFVEEQVMTKAPSERWETVPATYEWVEAKDISGLENVAAGKSLTDMDKTGPGGESAAKLEVSPATYEWVEEQVLAYPEHVHYEEVPAVYETVTEKVIDRPAHTVWKKGKGPIQRIDYATGEIMCLVEVPATYKTITKRILVQAATTREITNPAKYTTVKKQIIKTPPTVRKQIIKTPATVRRIEIPAEYKTVKVRKLADPAQIQRIAIPEEFQTVSRRELLTEGKMQWQPILCETNVTHEIIHSLQSALKDEGYDPGRIDGSLGRQTMIAVQAYQKDKGLPSGELTLETLKSLKVDFK